MLLTKFWRMLPEAIVLLELATQLEGQGLHPAGSGGGLSMRASSWGNQSKPGWRALGTIKSGAPPVHVGLRL